jgi:Cu+-exporting ATPase
VASPDGERCRDYRPYSSATLRVAWRRPAEGSFRLVRLYLCAVQHDAHTTTLEPLVVTAEASPNHELLDMTRRFWIGLALSLPVLVLEMGGHVPWLGLHHIVSERLSTWIQFALSTPVVLWAGWPFFKRAWASVVNRSLNMFSLIALGTGAAYLYSLVAAFEPNLFPAGFRGMDNAVAVYFEAAAVITVLVLLGQVLELRAREQTGGAIRALLNLAPKIARRLKDGGEDELGGGDGLNVRGRFRPSPVERE